MEPPSEVLSVSPLSNSHFSVSSRSSTQSPIDETTTQDHPDELRGTSTPQSILEAGQNPRLGSANYLSEPKTALNTSSPKPWKPAYLELRRLVIFPILFSSYIIATQVLVHISQSNHGLTTANRNLHYLWTFGPMAALTLLAASWSRVEFQVKCMAPWVHMEKGERAEKTLLLNYFSMLQPVAIIRAIKLQDWVVASVSLCSLALRVAIVFSTALITLAQIRTYDANFPVVIRSSFVESTTQLYDGATNIGGLPYYSNGTWTNYAFQQFDPTNVPDGKLNITVEGFTSSLVCEPASLNTSYSACSDLGDPCWALETNLCQYPIEILPRTHIVSNIPPRWNSTPTYQGKMGYTSTYQGYMGLSGCNNSKNLDDKILYAIFGELKTNTNFEVSENFLRSAHIVCRASYAVDQVDVISDHTGVTSVSKSITGASRSIERLTGGHMLDFYVQSWSSPYIRVSDEDISLVEDNGEANYVNTDELFIDVLKFAKLSSSPASKLMEESFLEEIVNHHFQQATVFIGRSFLSVRTAQNRTGRIYLKKERLVVSAAIGHITTALLSVAILLSISVLSTRSSTSHLPKNPNSVIGMAQLLADSKEALGSCAGSGPVSDSTMLNRLRDFTFKLTTAKSTNSSRSPAELIRISVSSASSETHDLRYLNAPAKVMKAPLVLSPVFLVGVQTLIIGTIVALEVIIRVSGDDNDFVDVPDQWYIHFAWTIIPALYMSLIAMYFAAMDSEVRSLAPYSNLGKGSPLSRIIGLDLVNGSTPRLIWREYRSESFAALATTLCVLASSFLTIFVGSLYSVVTLPIDTEIQLQTVSSFTVQRNETTHDGFMGQLEYSPSFTSTLILKGNLSYPSFTYESLAFPEFSIIIETGSLHISPNDVISAIVPALRSKMSCTRYTSSEIQMEVFKDKDLGEVLGINIDSEQHQSQFFLNPLKYNAEIPIGKIFGIGESCNYTYQMIWCTSDFLYIWGRTTNTTSQDGSHIAALTCNETIEAVDVTTTFLGPQLSIDLSSPPRPIKDSARRSSVKLYTGEEPFTSKALLSPYEWLARGLGAPGTSFWPFFDALTTSRYAITLDDLGDPKRDEAVAQAIVWQHGIIRAQLLNKDFRGPANTTNATLANPPASTDVANDAIAYAGTLHNSSGRTRLAQDPATARVLEALLVLVLVLSTAGRLLMRHVHLLPRNPTSIANVAALLADGNLLSSELLPTNAQLLSDDEILATVGREYLLRLGWWASNPEDASSRRFGIFAVKTSNESVFDWS